MKEEIQVVTATSEPAEETTRLNNDDFAKKLLEELHGKNIWRKLESLAEALDVDVQSLRMKLDSMPHILRKCGKEDGIYYYCWEKRYQKEINHNPKSENKLNTRPSVREEDRYALAMLHMIYWTFYKALKTYGLEISQIDNDAFNNFAVALDKLESGLVLFSNKSGASIDKLPKFS